MHTFTSKYVHHTHITHHIHCDFIKDDLGFKGLAQSRAEKAIKNYKNNEINNDNSSNKK